MAKTLKNTPVQLLWGGNFKQMPDQQVLDFTSGWDVKSKPAYDERLLPYDIKVNQVHSQMLAQQGIITSSELEKISACLDQIKDLHRTGKFKLNPFLEDVHTNIENYLVKKIGIRIAGKLHTARSRNDQVTTDMHLYLKDQCLQYGVNLKGLRQVLTEHQQRYKKVRMPGFTHHRLAMVTNLGLIFGAWKTSLQRDEKRFIDWLDLYDKCPLGGAAGYGTSFQISRQYTSKHLGFKSPYENMLDPITNRGEPETTLAFAITILMKHFSQIAQTLIIFSMPQFDYLRLSDQFCTGSSIMPHKKNPDILEAIKAKTVVANGLLNSLMIINSSNLVGYNKDTQWTKYLIMDLIDETLPSLMIMTRLLSDLIVNKQKLEQSCQTNALNVTLMMEQKVKQTGQPFRCVKRTMERRCK